MVSDLRNVAGANRVELTVLHVLRVAFGTWELIPENLPFGMGHNKRRDYR